MAMVTETGEVEALLPTEAEAMGLKPEKWPLEVRALIAYLSQPTAAGKNMRKRPRKPLRIEASLRLGNEIDAASPTPIYTRDTSGPVVGILTQTPAKVGEHVRLEWDDATGITRRLDCRVMRCRQCRDGWYEGALVLDGFDPNGTRAEKTGFWRQLRGLLGA